MEEQIEKEKNKNIYLLNIEKQKIFDKYSDIFNIEKINEIFNENDIDKKINILQTMIENSSNELTKLEIKQEEFEEQSSEIVRLEEEQEILGSQLKELKEKNDAIELVKETIEKAYEKLIENINPEFNKKLSENISKNLLNLISSSSVVLISFSELIYSCALKNAFPIFSSLNESNWLLST